MMICIRTYVQKNSYEYIAVINLRQKKNKIIYFFLFVCVSIYIFIFTLKNIISPGAIYEETCFNPNIKICFTPVFLVFF